MKKFVLFIVMILPGVLLYSNPLLTPNLTLIGEIYFNDNDEWFIEFNTCNFDFALDNFDGISIESSSGMAEIKTGILITDSTVLITNDSLLTALQINPAGDYIKIIAPQGVDLLAYGDFESELCYYFGNYQFSHVGELFSGQSYCISTDDFYVSYLTKTNSSTIGYCNSSIRYYGDILINVKNSNNEPISEVNCFFEQYAFNYEASLIYGDFYEYDVELTTSFDDQANTEGVIDFSDFDIYAMNCNLIFKTSDGNFQYDTLITISVEPDVENVFDIVLDCDMIWVDVEIETVDRELLEVFPNPANEQLNISFPDKNITIKKFAVVKVFSEKGDLIKIVPVSNTNDGIQDFTIDIADMSLGNYYCNLEVDGQKISVSKFIVLK